MLVNQVLLVTKQATSVCEMDNTNGTLQMKPVANKETYTINEDRIQRQTFWSFFRTESSKDRYPGPTKLLS